MHQLYPPAGTVLGRFSARAQGSGALASERGMRTFRARRTQYLGQQRAPDIHHSANKVAISDVRASSERVGPVMKTPPDNIVR